MIVFVLLATGIYAVSGQFSPPGQSHSPTAHQSQTFRLLPGSPSLGPATAYELTGPQGVALDRLGNLYFTDTNEVFRVDHSTDALSVVAGGGTPTAHHSFWGDGGRALDAGLFAPSGVAIARNGDIYILDGNYRVRKVSAATGIITTVAGDGGHGSSGNGGPAVEAQVDPAAIALGPNGDLYIADVASNTVRQLSSSTGMITSIAGNGQSGSQGDGGPAINATLAHPRSLAFDRKGNLFISTNDRIRVVSASTGTIRTIYRATGKEPYLGWPGSLAIGPHSVLYLTGGYGRQVLTLGVSSGRTHVIAGTGNQTMQQPGATAGDGGPASRATFGLPSGIVVGPSGTIYVADFFNNAVRMINEATGIITTVAGQIPQSPAHCC